MSRSNSLRIDDQLCFALYAATNVITRAYRPLLRRLGITYPQYLALMVLWQHGASTVGEIAARLALPGHAVTPMLDRLQTAGLLVRRRVEHDGRVVLVDLTPAGRTLERAAAEVQRTVACATGLSPDELADLRSQLHDLTARMSDEPAGPVHVEVEA